MRDAPAARYDRLDALRGAAIVWMTAYHFCYDLNHLRWLRADFHHDPFWTVQRTCIVSLFLFCAGLGQAAAQHQGQGWPRFWKRWAQVAGCALLVTAGSYVMFPHSFIYFGVLHGIAVMLVIVRLTAGWGSWLWPAGALAIAGPWLVQPLLAELPALASALERPALNWIGWIRNKPRTEDYVPIFPWLGVMWWGMAAGAWLLRNRPAALQGPRPAGTAALAWMGRWSLSWYMLHQPALLGLLYAARALK